MIEAKIIPITKIISAACRDFMAFRRVNSFEFKHECFLFPERVCFLHVHSNSNTSVHFFQERARFLHVHSNSNANVPFSRNVFVFCTFIRIQTQMFPLPGTCLFSARSFGFKHRCFKVECSEGGGARGGDRPSS